MLDHPKFIWFFVLFFGILHALVYMIDGQYRPDALPTMSSITDLWEIAKFVGFNYHTYLPGKLVWVAWMLSVVEIGGVALIMVGAATKALSWLTGR